MSTEHLSHLRIEHKTETQELRELLQSALSDYRAAEMRLADARDQLCTRDSQLLEVTYERNKLRQEKALVWGRVLGDGEDSEC